jgi:DNA-binding MarR family transcriptional regulator
MPTERSVFDPSSQHGDVDNKIVAALERLGQVFGALLRGKAEESSLSPIQIRIVVHLLFHPAGFCHVGDLARQFDLTYATVSDAVSTLVRKEVVSKEPDPDDGRARILRLTEEGEAWAEDLSGWAGTVQRVVKSHLGGHSDAEKVIVMRFLMDLIAELQEEGVITVARMCKTCRFFDKNRYPDSEGAPHHCKLLDEPLKLHDLRIDCPEHELPDEETATA